MSRRVRCPLAPITEGDLPLDANATHYLLRVHRLRAGDQFLAFDPAARLEADATLLSDHPKGAHCRLGPTRPAQLVARLPLTLLQGVGKGDKVERVVRDATQLGLQTLLLVETDRSVPKLIAKRAEKQQRYLRIAIEAARQSGRGDVPALRGPMTLEAALLETQDIAVKLVCDAQGRSISDTIQGSRQTGVAALIGPEGGLAPNELQLASEHGYTRTSLGPFTLRTETAAVAALAVIAELTRRPPSC